MLNNALISIISISFVGLTGAIQIGSLFNDTEKVKEILKMWSLNLGNAGNLPFDEGNATDPIDTKDDGNAVMPKGKVE